MFLIDDILLSPYKGIKWIFKEIHRLTEEELEGESKRITQELTELYRKLELGDITEAEFDESEEILLNRLDELEEELCNTGDSEDQELENEVSTKESV